MCHPAHSAPFRFSELLWKKGLGSSMQPGARFLKQSEAERCFSPSQELRLPCRHCRRLCNGLERRSCAWAVSLQVTWGPLWVACPWLLRPNRKLRYSVIPLFLPKRSYSVVGAARCAIRGVGVTQALHITGVKPEGSLSLTGTMQQLGTFWRELFPYHIITNVTGSLTSLFFFFFLI